MKPHEMAEARYDTMPEAVAERVYRNPLARQLAAAEGQVKMMTRMIRETVDNIRWNPPSYLLESLRQDIRDMWAHRRMKQAEARELRLVIASNAAMRRLSAAQ